MHPITESVLIFLLNRKYIGGRHTPESMLIKLKTKYSAKEEIKAFEDEYKQLINDAMIMKTKKRTGKGSSWHISLNPGKVYELKRLLNLEGN